ncbi:MAG: DUF924 domain-containing protein [Cyanobacteria bacterium]|nr:DUF924 domain-containing protein [Cyanobacteriota bacterium]
MDGDEPPGEGLGRIEPDAQAVLDFWFGPPNAADYGQPRRFWFTKDAAFDAALGDRFGGLYGRAIAGACDGWREDPRGCLALIIVLDQFSRNLYRDRAEAFAADAQALGLAKFALARNYDRAVAPVQRWFFYLPLEHSESLADQDQSVACFEALRPERSDPSADPEPYALDDAAIASVIDYAHRHRAIIRRFGRFPHRNHLLGRTSTPGEAAFLKQPGSSF